MRRTAALALSALAILAGGIAPASASAAPVVNMSVCSNCA